jgi:hypothetical protein
MVGRRINMVSNAPREAMRQPLELFNTLEITAILSACSVPFPAGPLHADAQKDIRWRGMSCGSGQNKKAYGYLGKKQAASSEIETEN